MRNLTQTCNSIARILPIDAYVIPEGVIDFNKPQHSIDNLYKFWGIWDTGASQTAISKKIIDKLALPIISMATISTANGKIDTTQHLVDLVLPNRVVIRKLLVTCAKLIEPTDILVGMDVIGQGDFAITNFSGQTCVSFRFPSMERIDFCKQKPKPYINSEREIGRNDPCHCGSNKKYKMCCGKNK